MAYGGGGYFDWIVVIPVPDLELPVPDLEIPGGDFTFKKSYSKLPPVSSRLFGCHYPLGCDLKLNPNESQVSERYSTEKLSNVET